MKDPTQKIVMEAAKACVGRDEMLEWYYDLINSVIEKATERITAERDHYKMLTQELGQELRAAHANEQGADTKRLIGLLTHVAFSNHGFKPESCSGCADANKTIDAAMKEQK